MGLGGVDERLAAPRLHVVLGSWLGSYEGAQDPNTPHMQQRGEEPNVIADTTLVSACEKGEISACEKDHQAENDMELGGVDMQQRGLSPHHNTQRSHQCLREGRQS